ncbi:MAG: hypothetical protein AB7Y46_17685 [Armatimonadota bacterium]
MRCSSTGLLLASVIVLLSAGVWADGNAAALDGAQVAQIRAPAPGI